MIITDKENRQHVLLMAIEAEDVYFFFYDQLIVLTSHERFHERGRLLVKLSYSIFIERWAIFYYNMSFVFLLLTDMIELPHSDFHFPWQLTRTAAWLVYKTWLQTSCSLKLSTKRRQARLNLLEIGLTSISLGEWRKLSGNIPTYNHLHFREMKVHEALFPFLISERNV